MVRIDGAKNKVGGWRMVVLKRRWGPHEKRRQPRAAVVVPRSSRGVKD